MTNEMMSPEKTGFSSKRLERIKPAMQSYVDQKISVGISTMMARKGKIIHFEQVGWMDKGANKPMSDDAIFRIYSMTKPIICVALMTLYEKGRFQLFDPVAKYIPAFGTLKVYQNIANEMKGLVDLNRPVTIHDLLTHTAGLTYDFLEESPVAEGYRQARLVSNIERTLEELVQELTRLPLVCQPGTEWHYSLAFDVAAHLIEIISGQSLNHFLKETIFRPLEMQDTDFHVPSEKQIRLSRMHGYADILAPDMTQKKAMAAWDKECNSPIDVSGTYPATRLESFARGGHGLFSTASDYMRFSLMLINQGELGGVRILGRKTVDLMHMNHLSPDLLPIRIGYSPPYLGYGFGLGSRVLVNVADSKMPGSIGEFGWAGAARTYFWIDPQEQIIGLFLTQNIADLNLPEKDFQVLIYQALVD